MYKKPSQTQNMVTVIFTCSVTVIMLFLAMSLVPSEKCQSTLLRQKPNMFSVYFTVCICR